MQLKQLGREEIPQFLTQRLLEEGQKQQDPEVDRLINRVPGVGDPLT
jgi:hypothetical protein